jgi:16S rRNA (guanine527-N7)-methyltransferase
MAPAPHLEGEDLSPRLHDAARSLGLALEPAQASQLLAYLACLQRWNNVHSLSAWKSASDLLVHHVFDSLTLVAPLSRFFSSGALRVLDAGSGPGFPAAVLAATRREWSVTAVDAVAKKVAFIRQAAAEARLGNLAAVHARLEDLKAAELFDVVVSRAFASLDRFTAVTDHLLKPGGVWVAQKGRVPDDEVVHLRDDLRVFHVEPVTVPGLNAQRHLIWMDRIAR